MHRVVVVCIRTACNNRGNLSRTAKAPAATLTILSYSHEAEKPNYGTRKKGRVSNVSAPIESEDFAVGVASAEPNCSLPKNRVWGGTRSRLLNGPCDPTLLTGKAVGVGYTSETLSYSAVTFHAPNLLRSSCDCVEKPGQTYLSNERARRYRSYTIEPGIQNIVLNGGKQHHAEHHEYRVPGAGQKQNGTV